MQKRFRKDYFRQVWEALSLYNSGPFWGNRCTCLLVFMDFSDKEFMLNKLIKFTYLLIPVFRILGSVMGNFRLNTYTLVSYDTLSDSCEMNSLVKEDPQQEPIFP